jgi:uncharacterized protein
MSTLTLTDNAATIASVYEAFGRGDIPFILSNLTDNCHWVAMGKGSSTQGGAYTGKGVIDFFTRLLDDSEFLEFNPVSIHKVNESLVVAFGNMKCKAKATGKPYSSEWAMRWEFNAEGKITAFENYHDTAAFYIANQL